ncbi:P-loop containing nucleoside triphosphate hydrolase protein [Artomyces pyxidatus]|uniref:P-loop containing nucleoside triphosphate hydrolase protein n=1 Tax=Artomyces pyxidatus TaxID=48021 RepID=A0ACB8STX3_9AGAM|nr:P-loop containing nucleoside triphosphate hydrolase protein [Artomyces pyxidatus]
MTARRRIEVAPRDPFDRESVPHAEFRTRDGTRGLSPRQGDRQRVQREGSSGESGDRRDNGAPGTARTRKQEGDFRGVRGDWKGPGYRGERLKDGGSERRYTDRPSWKRENSDGWKSNRGPSLARAGRTDDKRPRRDDSRPNWSGEKRDGRKNGDERSWRREIKPSWRGHDGSSRRDIDKEPRVRNDGGQGSRDDKSWGWKDRPDRDVRQYRSSPSSYARAADKAASHVEAEFDFSAKPEPPRALPATFASPPLVDGLLRSVQEVLGPTARPTPIQALALKHLFSEPADGAYRQFLLASETGSGKSIAYMLPMLQALKQAEIERPPPLHRPHPLNPRGLVLAPTHELSRQLTAFAKALIHNIKLRVQSVSRANVATASSHFGGRGRVTASKMAAAFGEVRGESGEFEVKKGGSGHDVDLLVGTPSKILELVRGNGWDRQFEEDEEERAKSWVVGRPQMGLADVEWVVIDEADILFDADFIEETGQLLSDIAAARGHPVPLLYTPRDPNQVEAPLPTPVAYPFNFVLTSATFPAALAAHLDNHHPSMTRLVSPNLHRLPKNLALEFAPYASGNRNADVATKIRAIWQENALVGQEPSRIVVFGNTRTRVEEMGKYLDEHKIANVVVTGGGGRLHGSNRHLAGFLKPTSRPAPSSDIATDSASQDASTSAIESGDEAAAAPSTNSETSAAENLPTSEGAKVDASPADDEQPRVLLSTSLLARGLDFDPSVSHVLVLEPPRNTADFLHRAGRTARAGQKGRVIVFGKGGGRGADRVREMRRRVEALRAR